MSAATYFDSRHQLMQQSAEAGAAAICYDQQVALLESIIQPGMTVLDVGCGPRLPYRAPHAWIIGLDPSADSLAENTDVDDRIVGSAANIPLDDASVDLAVAFYSFHHMTTQTFDGSQIRREWALEEMARVTRPGGEILVFEISPWRPVWWGERAFWDLAKALLGDRFDVCFAPASEYARTPLGVPTVQTFHCSPFALFPPVFALPWLKIPRFLFPFDAVLYRWRLP